MDFDWSDAGTVGGTDAGANVQSDKEKRGSGARSWDVHVFNSTLKWMVEKGDLVLEKSTYKLPSVVEAKTQPEAAAGDQGNNEGDGSNDGGGTGGEKTAVEVKTETKAAAGDQGDNEGDGSNDGGGHGGEKTTSSSAEKRPAPSNEEGSAPPAEGPVAACRRAILAYLNAAPRQYASAPTIVKRVQESEQKKEIKRRKKIRHERRAGRCGGYRWNVHAFNHTLRKMVEEGTLVQEKSTYKLPPEAAAPSEAASGHGGDDDDDRGAGGGPAPPAEGRVAAACRKGILAYLRNAPRPYACAATIAKYVRENEEKNHEEKRGQQSQEKEGKDAKESVRENEEKNREEKQSQQSQEEKGKDTKAKEAATVDAN